jgi:transposase
MKERSGGATALLGMDGFVVLTSTEIDGELWLLVETNRDVVGCARCGVRATGHGRSVVSVRDLPIGGRPVRLLWRKRRWICADGDCPAMSFTESSALVAGCLTTRASAEICRLVGEEGQSVASVARFFGVGWHRAWSAVERHGRPLVDDPRRRPKVRALGVDEHKMLAAGPSHHTVYATQFVDIDRHRLLDVVPHRSAASVSTWLARRPRWFKDHVEVCAIDPHAGSDKALSRSLPRSTITVDVFHAVRLANACVDDVRRRVQRETLGHRGRQDDPLFGIRRLLTRGDERLSERQLGRLEQGLRFGDPFDEVGGAWAVKEQLRSVYAARTLEAARPELTSFYELAHDAGTPEVVRLASTIRRWEPDPELLHHRTHQRSQRGPEPDHREAPSHRPRDEQFRALSASALAPLRRGMGHSPDCSNQGPSPTSCRVEPGNPSGGSP